MIGIFDSGLGGLTVLKAIRSVLPQYDYLYLGDTARVPYGGRSQETVYQFACQGVDFLFKHGANIIILACNTASSEALRRIQREYLVAHYPEKRVLGVIRPLAELAARKTKNKRVGVIGTRGTVSSGAYVREILAQDKKIFVFQNSAPLLVPLIEEGWMKRPETKKIIKCYLRPLLNEKIDTLILGCTHYQIIHKFIQDISGKRCRVLDSGEAVAKSFQDYLFRHPEIEKTLSYNKSARFFVTDVTERFAQNAQNWLNHSFQLEKVLL